MSMRGDKCASEKEKGLAGVEPRTCGFERQRLTPTPCRPAVSSLVYVIYDL